MAARRRKSGRDGGGPSGFFVGRHDPDFQNLHRQTKRAAMVAQTFQTQGWASGSVTWWRELSRVYVIENYRPRCEDAARHRLPERAEKARDNRASSMELPSACGRTEALIRDPGRVSIKFAKEFRVMLSRISRPGMVAADGGR